MFSTWSVAQLKTELRKRGARTTGKMPALIERLESYDRNKLYGVEDEIEDEVLELPDLNRFRDVNASTDLPPLTRHHNQEFAERFDVPSNGKILYENRCLVTLRVAFEGAVRF